MALTRYLAAYDLHLGYERRGGHRVPLHDYKAWGALLAFAADFKPDVWIWGGDILDCGAVSHHNKGKPRRTEGFRLVADAEECVREVILPARATCARKAQEIFLPGNHEDWIEDVLDEDPALEGLVSLDTLLHLSCNGVDVKPYGARAKVGKISFVHGHQVKGGEHVAKSAVVSWETNIRFGHHHTYQTYTKTSPIDQKLGKTGIAVPCLCSKEPKYGEGAPNRWVQGFAFGEIQPNGDFTDYVAVIVDGKFVWNSKVYCG